jgi:hypothetical protein
MFNQYDSVENRNTKSAIKPTPAEILKAILSSIKKYSAHCRKWY